MKKNILVILSNSIGGTRKHVHSFLLSSKLESNYYYIYNDKIVDCKFTEELPLIQDKVCSVENITIRKKPSISDILNLVKIYRICKKNKIDIIHSHGAKAGLYGRVVSATLKLKCIYTPHGGVIHDIYGALNYKIFGFIEKMLVRFTSFYIFESEFTKQSFINLVNSKKLECKVIYNGIESVDEVATTTQVDGSKIRIGIIGELRTEKGQIYGLEALSMLRNDLFEIHLAGTGRAREELMQYAQEAGIQENSFFHGDVSDIYSFIDEMNVVLIPSLVESFGYVALEAANRQKFVIATNVGGLREVVMPNNGMLIEPKNPKAIADAIMAFYENACVFSRDVRIDHRFLLATMVNEIENVYKQLL